MEHPHPALKALNVAHEVESLTHFTIEAAETFAHFVGRYVDAGCAASTPPAPVNPECRQGPQTYRAPATDLLEKMAAWDLHARAR